MTFVGALRWPGSTRPVCSQVEAVSRVPAAPPRAPAQCGGQHFAGTRHRHLLIHRRDRRHLVRVGEGGPGAAHHGPRVSDRQTGSPNFDGAATSHRAPLSPSTPISPNDDRRRESTSMIHRPPIHRVQSHRRRRHTQGCSDRQPKCCTRAGSNRTCCRWRECLMTFGHIREKSYVQVDGVVAARTRAATWTRNFPVPL